MKHQVICIGAVLVDELYYTYEPVIAATSNPAQMKRSAGGVMRNIAHHLVLLGIPTTFITVTGNDSDGNWLMDSCRALGMDMRYALQADCTTGKYAALINPDGSLFAAAAINPCEAFFTVAFFETRQTILQQATVIVADTNLSVSVLEWLIGFCSAQSILLCIEPVSIAKAKKLSQLDLHGVYMLTPNEDELQAISNGDTTMAAQNLLDRGVQRVWLTRGKEGSCLYGGNRELALAALPVTVKDVTGAGDAMLAAWIAAFCLDQNEIRCLQAGHVLAAAVLQVEGAIDTFMTPEKLLAGIQTHYHEEQ